MQNDRDVLTRLHHLIQIADRSLADCLGQRAIDPHRVAALQQIAPCEVCGRQIVVTRHRVKRAAEALRHVRHVPGLAAAGRPLQKQRHPVAIRILEELTLGAGFAVIRQLMRSHCADCRRSRHPVSFSRSHGGLDRRSVRSLLSSLRRGADRRLEIGRLVLARRAEYRVDVQQRRQDDEEAGA